MIYLFHFMALSVLGRLVLQIFGGKGLAGGIVLFVAGFLLVNFAGWVLYVVFERPVLRWLHRVTPSNSMHPINVNAVASEPIRLRAGSASS